MDVLMPQLGETVAEGKITKWYKSTGDAVQPGDNLFEIETDKVSMEVPATSPGVLAEIRVAAGEVAPVGAIVAVIAGDGEVASVAGTGAAEMPKSAAAAATKPADVTAVPPTAQQSPLMARTAGTASFAATPGAALPTAAVSAGTPRAPAAPAKLDPFFEV